MKTALYYSLASVALMAAAKDAGAQTEPQTETAQTVNTGVPAVVIDSATKTMVMPNGIKFKVAKAVSRPTLTHKPQTAAYLTILAPIETKLTKEKAEITEKDADGKPVKKIVDVDKEIRTVGVTNLEDGQEYNYVVNAVTDSELNTSYPENGYVGKSFAILKGGKREGKNFNDIFITEIEPV